MVSDIYCKLNKFEPKTEEISEINSKKIGELPINIAQLQKKHGDLFAIAATQHELQKKAIKKIPTFIETGCILEKRAYEQCTSEEVAFWKANYFKSNNLLSLTGGLGVDEWAWAKSGALVTSFDIDANLNHLANYNFEKLGVSITRITGECSNFLGTNSLNNFDLIYVDPDRREGNQRIVNQVAQYSPNIFELIKNTSYQSVPWLIKLSPMVDTDFIDIHLPGHKQYFAIVSKQEVKELLVYVQFKEPILPTKEVVVLENGNANCYSEAFSQEMVLSTKYLFEPNAGILCLKLNRELANREHFKSLNSQQTFFEISEKVHPSMGRVFRALHEEPIVGGLKKIGKTIKEQFQTELMSITARECKISTEEIRKILGVKDSDKNYLLLTKQGNDFVAWFCNKVI